MALGYDGKLYILAFDHRGSFQKRFFGIEGEPDPEQTAIIADAKHLRERVIDLEGSRATLFLPGRYQSVVIGVAAMG